MRVVGSSYSEAALSPVTTVTATIPETVKTRIVPMIAIQIGSCDSPGFGFREQVNKFFDEQFCCNYLRVATLSKTFIFSNK